MGHCLCSGIVFKKLKYKKLRMSELGQLLPGDGPIKLKISAYLQDMGENVLQYVFFKNPN